MRTQLLVAGVLAVVIISAAGVTYTSSSAFCGTSCHWMSTRYVTWKHSTHGEVGCLECHAEPGFVGEMEAHINGVRYLGPVFTGRLTKPIIRAEVRDSSCKQCHRDVLDPLWKDARISAAAYSPLQLHGAHLAEDAACTDCHANLVHATFRLREALPEREVCDRCHADEGVFLPL